MFFDEEDPIYNRESLEETSDLEVSNIVVAVEAPENFNVSRF